jgi:hypothetical protein
MNTSIRFPGLIAASAFGLTTILLSGCASSPTSSTPTTPTDTNSVTVDEFFTPPPTGEADDYYVLSNGDDDVQYSYFLDEQDYFDARDAKDDNGEHDRKFKFAKGLFKNGHGYGDHNHIHFHLKGAHHYHGIYIGVRDEDWTDSLALTPAEKLSIDSGMKAFHHCADAAIDTFKIDLKPFRTRDSARVMLDSAISLYLTETDLLRKSFVAEVKVCLTELDAYLHTRLTAAQYAIWVRHRGW